MNKKSRQQVGMISTLVRGFDTWTCVLALFVAACLLMGVSNAYAADPFEGSGNNTRATATAITFSGDTAVFAGAEIDGIEDLDWYSFAAVAKDSINITLTNGTANFNGKVVVYNGSDQKVLEADAALGGGNESISGVVLENAGTYYIGVGLATNAALARPAGFSTGEYRLDVKKTAGAAGDANEVNDTRAAATALSFTANQATAMGKVGTLIDQDWFSFSASKTTGARDSITISLTASALKAGLTLYDSAGVSLVARTAMAAGETVTIGEYLAAYTGTYYLAVTGVSSTGAYTLTVNKASVAVVNYPPMASFTVTPSAGYATITNFAFDASGSSDSDDMVSALRFSWDFNGDGTYEITDSTAATAAHVFADTGSFWVKVRVKDTGDSTAVDSMMVSVRDAASNTAPTASASVSPMAGPVSQEFTFSSDMSSDAQDVIADLRFSWDFENDGTYDVSGTAAQSVTHMYGDTGTYVAKLKVTDTGGLSDSATVEVHVTPNTAPTAVFSAYPSVGAVNETEFWVDASMSADMEDAASALQVQWDWESDGTFDTDYSTTKTASHVFADTGLMTITLRVKDTGGLTATATQTVHVVEVQAGTEYTLSVMMDSTISFGSAAKFKSWFNIKFTSGDVVGKSIKFIGYGVALPEELMLPGASEHNGAYYQITSTEVTMFTANIEFEYTDSILVGMGIPETELAIAYYDEMNGAWVLASMAAPDTANNKITVTGIDHFSYWAIAHGPTVDVEENPGGGIPATYELAQNYPNPFNPTTKIDFNMPKSGMVSVTIYNIIGQKVRTLINETKAAGSHSIIWDGANDFGVKMSSGVYIYRMETAEFVSTRKMMLIK